MKEWTKESQKLEEGPVIHLEPLRASVKKVPNRKMLTYMDSGLKNSRFYSAELALQQSKNIELANISKWMTKWKIKDSPRKKNLK